MKLTLLAEEAFAAKRLEEPAGRVLHLREQHHRIDIAVEESASSVAEETTAQAQTLKLAEKIDLG